jgi:hypothetical protein
MDSDAGQWSYPYDATGIIKSNVTAGSAKYSDIKIFNAKTAYDEAVQTASYSVAENPDIKEFKFRFTTTNGTVNEFAILVTKD